MLTLSQSVVTTDTDYGTALLDERSGRYWTLNPTATLVLRVLLNGGDPPRAARALADQYDVTPAMAEADVDKLVDDLCGAGLLTDASDGVDTAGGPDTQLRPARSAGAHRRHGSRRAPWWPFDRDTQRGAAQGGRR
jgi:Coenzyme PQQ synthesis protein D (PqqD)